MSQEPLTEAIQHYLREIYKLGQGREPVAVGALARAQGVSAASASAMVKKLTALDLAEHPPYRGVSLTPVLERGVRLLERILELVPLEDVVDGARRLAVSLLRVDDTSHRPERTGLALDPDQDPLLVPGVVDAVENPLGESAPVGRNRHGPDYTIGPVARLGSSWRNPFA